jgi:hypothetical protein
MESLEAQCADLPTEEQAGQAMDRLRELQKQYALLEKRLGQTPAAEHPIFGTLSGEEIVEKARADTDAYIQGGLGNSYYLAGNQADALLNTWGVMQAIQYAVDREEIVNLALYGFGNTVIAPLSPDSPHYPHEYEYERDLELAREWLNSKLANVDMDKVYDVDFEIDAEDLAIPMFQALDQNKTLWGHNVNEPLFAIKNLRISSANARICGKSQNTIQIYDDIADVKYVMFFCSGKEELYQWIDNNWGDDEAIITVVGTLGLSLFGGKLDQQVIINDAKIEQTIQN